MRTGEGIRVLHGHGLAHESAPLVRTLIHHLAALTWLAKVPTDALEELRRDHARQQEWLRQHAEKRKWTLKAKGPSPHDAESAKSAGAAHLERPERLFAEAGRSDLYVGYRVESSFVHPSVLGADVYLDPSGHFTTSPGTHAPPTPLHDVARWCAQATVAARNLVVLPRIDAVLGELSTLLGVDLAPPATWDFQPDVSRSGSDLHDT